MDVFYNVIIIIPTTNPPSTLTTVLTYPSSFVLQLHLLLLLPVLFYAFEFVYYIILKEVVFVSIQCSAQLLYIILYYTAFSHMRIVLFSSAHVNSRSSWPDKTGSLRNWACKFQTELQTEARSFLLQDFVVRNVAANTMISLQQQQKPVDLLLSWKLQRGEHSPPPAASLSSSSFGCALETSMKVWQVSQLASYWQGYWFQPARKFSQQNHIASYGSYIFFKVTFFISMQPINKSSDPTGPVVGGLNEKCLGNALDMTWLDWTKPGAPSGQGQKYVSCMVSKAVWSVSYKV